MDTKIMEILWELSQGSPTDNPVFGRISWQRMKGNVYYENTLEIQQNWFFSWYFICSFKVHNHKNVISYQVL